MVDRLGFFDDILQLIFKIWISLLSGLKYNSAGIPVIITNGIGTFRKDIRLFTPSEVVLVILHKY